MPTVSLSAFLKILTKGTPQKVQEYGKYLTPGGYDFYWRLKDAAAALTIGGQPFDQCVQPINQIKQDVERKHNFEGLKALNKWIAGRGTDLKFFQPPQAKCSTPKGLVHLRLEPEFGLIEGQRRTMVLLWNSKGADLKPVIAGIGIYLMKQHLAVGEFADCSCAILDLRKRGLLVSDKLPPSVPAIVATEFAWIDSFFEQHAKAA